MGVGLSFSLLLVLFTKGLDSLPIGALSEFALPTTGHIGNWFPPQATLFPFVPLGACPHGNYSNGTRIALPHSLGSSFPLDHIPRTFLAPP